MFTSTDYSLLLNEAIHKINIYETNKKFLKALTANNINFRSGATFMMTLRFSLLAVLDMI